MDVLAIVDTMSQEMYLRLKHAAETGKWPEGVPVEQAQRDSALQLIMAYQARHLDSDEMLTIGADGEIVNKTKRELKDQFSGKHKDTEVTKCNKNNIARFTDL
ncbi:transcriptional regulator [Thalassotalea insulae]|uniref:Transcriptional regulator n=1 Tax=Thalassotalea insulae TaxID=2056778 RepID=A0ABQ6GYB6_9GAMM|nr:DUF1315 family protein [Thalassotalea insulae]GLX80329.1 transcriptional regulator [Thalassotalea insulae]